METKGLKLQIYNICPDLLPAVLQECLSSKDKSAFRPVMSRHRWCPLTGTTVVPVLNGHLCILAGDDLTDKESINQYYSSTCIKRTPLHLNQ